MNSETPCKHSATSAHKTTSNSRILRVQKKNVQANCQWSRSEQRPRRTETGGFRSGRDSSTRFLLFFTARGSPRRRKDRTRKRDHIFHAKKDPLRLTRCRWHYICTRTTSRKRVHPAPEPGDFNWKFFHCTRRVRRVYVHRVLSWKTFDVDACRRDAIILTQFS